MDREVVGVAFLFWNGRNGCSGHLTIPHPQLLDVVWRSAVVVVAWRSCSCNLVVVWWSCSGSVVVVVVVK